jgi:ElaB/YqjD/DUF883 family membrane-anchored ribosome-binding protein
MPPPARGTFPVRRKFLDHASRNSAGVSRLLPLKDEIEMTTANEAYRRAANSPAAREAAETARNIGDDIADAAGEVGRFAGTQYGRARDAAVDAYDQVHAASERNPHLTLAVALGLGFLVGVVVATRR